MKTANIIALLLLALTGLGQAMADGAIELNMVAQEEITTLNAKGEKVVILVEPSAVVPGDMIVYTTHYHNKGKALAESVAITNPIPKETVYIDGSAMVENASVSYSVDGGKIFDAPGKLTITEGNGKTRPATANDYNHIRWTLKSVGPDGRGSVSFHAKVR